MTDISTTDQNSSIMNDSSQSENEEPKRKKGRPFGSKDSYKRKVRKRRKQLTKSMKKALAIARVHNKTTALAQTEHTLELKTKMTDVMEMIHKASPSSKYSAEVKLHCVFMFLGCQKTSQVSKWTGIPICTIRSWTQTDWWQAAYARAKEERNEDLDYQLTEDVMLGSDMIRDRLLNGEEVVFANGTRTKKGASLRDVTNATQISLNMRSLLRGQPTSITDRTDKGAVSELKDLLRQVAREEQKGNIIDVTPLVEKDDN